MISKTLLIYMLQFCDIMTSWRLYIILNDIFGLSKEFKVEFNRKMNLKEIMNTIKVENKRSHDINILYTQQLAKIYTNYTCL